MGRTITQRLNHLSVAEYIDSEVRLRCVVSKKRTAACTLVERFAVGGVGRVDVGVRGGWIAGRRADRALESDSAHAIKVAFARGPPV